MMLSKYNAAAELLRILGGVSTVRRWTTGGHTAA